MLSRRFDVLVDNLMAWRRNAEALLGDVSFKRNLRFLGLVTAVALACFVSLWWLGVGIEAEVYQQGDGRHSLTLAEYVFCVLGAIDADPGSAPVNTLYSAFVRLAGAIFIGGVLTSFLCTLLERFSDMTVRGLLVPALHDHTVIVGYSSLTDDLICKVLDGSKDAQHLDAWYPHYRKSGRPKKNGKVLLYTSGDVEKIRETLRAVLGKDSAKRVVYAFGDMDVSHVQRLDETCRKLCLQNARKVFVMGDDDDASRGDLKNMAFADAAGSFVQKHGKMSSESVPLPIYVQMGDLILFDLMKRMDFSFWGFVGKQVKTLSDIRAYVRPYNCAESWARTMWGVSFKTGFWDPLDFRRMGMGDYVHLVVVGLNTEGASLLNEAVRVCHYLEGEKTKITVVDCDPAVETAFRSLHPELFGLVDVEISFRNEFVQSPEVRNFLSTEAGNPHCLLTVAICVKRTERAIQLAATLPEILYQGYESQSGKPEGERISKREAYAIHPPRILVYQSHWMYGKHADAAMPIRYRWLRPFGMQEAGFNAHCMRGFSAMYLNAVYFWPKEMDGSSVLDVFDRPPVRRKCADLVPAVDAFRQKWNALIDKGDMSEIPADARCSFLKEVIGSQDSFLLAFKQYAFRRFVLMPPEKAWANVYVSDSYGTILRSLGLHAEVVEDFNEGSSVAFRELCEQNDRLFMAALAGEGVQDMLARAEHNRWMADRALMGYRRNDPQNGERRDDGYRYHDCMIPYEQLSVADKNKDSASIRYMPMFLALEGVAIRMDRSDR